MMRKVRAALLGGASLVLAVSPAVTRAAEAQQETSATDEAQEASSALAAGDIVVTARRMEESLQDVPQTVNVVDSKALENFNILQVGDISKVVSGLQLVGNDISMRGVTFVTISNATTPTVATYINDVPVPAVQFNTAAFDLGQIEVLRGPQGTLRGIASPSGALTATTRRPDLTTIDGYVMGSVGTLHNYNLQAAFGVPLIEDVLAVRVAGVMDRTEGNGVHSINNPEGPRKKTAAIRASVRFEPASNFSANIIYQHLASRDRSFGSAVFGNGSPGGVNPNAPAGFNGPRLTMRDFSALTELPTITEVTSDMVVAQLDWRVAGQRIAYIGSYDAINTQVPFAAGDAGNIIPGYEPSGPRQDALRKIWTHELRISSDERIAGIFDYVVGAFRQSDKTPVVATSGIVAFLPGAFGSPLATPFRPVPPNPRYIIDTFVFLPKENEETSFFANLTAHIGERLEISGGVRHIHSESLRDVAFETTPAFNATALPGSPAVAAGTCGFLNGQFGATYPGICDIPVPSSRTVLAAGNLAKHNAWIYDAAISFRVTDDLLAFAHVGSSWREGGFIIGINNARADPVLNSIIFQRPEKSTSYEAGLKWTFLDRRGRLNVTYYHQDFEGFIYTVPGCIRYLSYTSATGTPNVGTACNFGGNVPAKIDGIDVDAAVQVTPRWSVSGNFTWSNGRIKDALLPCNDGDFDGTPDGILPTTQAFINANTFVARCRLNGAPTTAPKWNMRVQSEYRAPVSNHVEAYVRGNFAYQPRNPNASQTYVVPAYALVDLFVGIRDPDGRWDLGAYGKNITKTRKVIALDAAQINPPANLRALFGDTGYRSFAYNPRREFGVTLRYSFGGR